MLKVGQEKLEALQSHSANKMETNGDFQNSTDRYSAQQGQNSAYATWKLISMRGKRKAINVCQIRSKTAIERTTFLEEMNKLRKVMAPFSHSQNTRTAM